MILQLGLQILLPVGLIAALLRSQYADRLRWGLEVGVFTLAIVFAVLTARWDMTSIHLRWMIPAMFLVAVAVSLRRIGSSDRASQDPFTLQNGINAVLIGGLLILNGMVLSGFRTPEDPVELELPLRDGRFYVGGGGLSRWINNHLAYPPQNHAVDFVQLNGLGNRGTLLPSPDLESYEIFASDVHSPCTGTVLVAVDGFPDLSPPERNTENPAGNHIVVACKGVEVLLAHLSTGSVTVEAGEPVGVGDRIGSVGNSGNTSQPHLHVHAERGGEPGVILVGEGVPITFGGKFAVRNTVF